MHYALDGASLLRLPFSRRRSNASQMDLCIRIHVLAKLGSSRNFDRRWKLNSSVLLHPVGARRLKLVTESARTPKCNADRSVVNENAKFGSGPRTSSGNVRFIKVALLCFSCLLATAGLAQNDAFTVTAFSYAIDENEPSLSDLGTRIASAINDTYFDNFEFELDARGESLLTATFTSASDVSLVFKNGTGFDYETHRTFTFRVLSTRKSTAPTNLEANSLSISVSINPIEEQPEVLPPYSTTDGRSFFIQRTPDIGAIPSVLAFQIFRDPEGSPIQFKPCGDDFQVSEYADAVGTGSGVVRGSAAEDVNQTGASNVNCANHADTNNYVASTDVRRGGEVVNVETFGQSIRITPIADTEDSGVRRAVLKFHGWAGAPIASASFDSMNSAHTIKRSQLATITVFVKTGVNNPPTFTSQAIGFRVHVNETTSENEERVIGPPTNPGSPTDWNATDLDNDTITYALTGASAPSTCSEEPSAVTVGRGCVWLDSTALGDGIVKIVGKNLDYETAPPPNREYVVHLTATDGYIPQGSPNVAQIPIFIRMVNVDEELEFNGPLDAIKQLVLGRAGRTVDLNDYFTDPDGLLINYSVFSSEPNIVNVTSSGSILTVSPVNTVGTTFVTITASTPGSSFANSQTIQVTVRETNRAPGFEGSVLTVRAPTPVRETQTTDHLIRVTGLRYLDPDGDTVTATVLNSSLFEAVVDPTIAETTYTGEIALKLVGSLDYETTSQHLVQVQLNDGWDNSIRSVEVIVDVEDVNESPQVTTDPQGNLRTIPNQTISVGGVQSIDVAEYFVDPDRDRLFFTASSTNPAFVTAQVTGQSFVEISGVQPTEGAPVTIVVTAADPIGLAAERRFQVVVSSNTPPRLVQAPVAQTLRTSDPAKEISLIGSFTDDDAGDQILRYEASSNDDSIVLAQVSNNGLYVVLIPRAEGTTNVVITAFDTRGGSTDTSFIVTVLANTPPHVIQRIPTVTLRPNVSTTIDVTLYFSDVDDDPLTYTASIDNPAIATSTLFNNQTLTIQGRTVGTAEATVTATDPHNESISTTFLVSVENDAPTVARDVTVDISHRNDSDVVDLAIHFNDANDDPLTYTVAVEDESIATASIEGASLTVTAVAIGTTDITVTAEDPYGAAVSSTFTVTIVNQGPTVVTAVADQISHRRGTLEVDLTPHFQDADGDALTFSVEVVDMSVATASVSGATLTINGVALGTTDVTITAEDAFEGSISSFFNVTIQNRDPEATMMIADQTMYRAMPMTIDLSESFNDPDMDALTFEVNVTDDTIVSAMITGSMLSIEGVGVGDSEVTVTASDGLGGQAASANFMVTVENRAPMVAIEIEDREAPRQVMTIVDLSMVFEDPDGDPLTFEANIANGAVATIDIQGSTLTVIGQTVNTTLITVTASDEYGGSAFDIFEIKIVNQAPRVAQEPDDVILNRTEMPTLDMSMVFADDDNDVLTLMATSATPAVARVDVDGFSVTLEPLTLGTTEVTLEVADPYNETATTSFQVTVENLAPTVSMTLPNVRMDRVDSVVVDVSAVFTDADGDAITISAESDDSNLLTTSVSGNSLTLDGVNLGTTNVTVTATDANGATVSTSFIVTVVNLDPTVTAVIDAFQLQVGGEPETRDVESAFGDDGPEALVLSVTASGPEVATAAVSGTLLTVTPVARGATSVTVTATDPQGATVEQVVSVSVSDSELKNVANATLASFSRAILSSVSSTVGARLLADSDGLYAPFTSFTLDDFAPSNDFAQSIDGFSNASPFANQSMPWSNTPSPAQSESGQYRSGDIASMLGRGFSLKLAAAGDPTFWSVWGGADRQSFEAENHEGSTSSYYFGGDMTIQGQWMFGVAIGRNAGNSDYTFGTATQSMDLALTSILPYARMTPSDRTTIYGTIGFGSGEVETSVIGATSDIADLKATIGLLGGRQIVYTMMNGFNLAVVGDFGFANLETDDTPGGAGNLVAETSRIRGGVESSFNLAMGADGSFVPFITVGFRSDSGDDEISDSGVEITGGLRIMNPIFSLDANFRTLATYGADDYSESGFSVMAALNPSAGATGLNVSIAPSWGASTVSSNALWQDDFKANRFHEMAAFANLNRESVKWDSYVGYGFLVLHERFILTPFLDIRTGYTNDQDFSIGAKLIQSSNSKQDLNVDVKIGQDSSMTGTQEESVHVNARLNF